ncbi:GumC domain-containing protein [Flavobacterium ustbae]|uniref:Wzz/FepE/Etk N-terminal domain-containing protein n=1 Tax=Flavobacterium ustbae TaxID=2488790 RepID=UPI00293913A9|nr:Wzz/FepE/Etk N-terminal domain-containing protein [Flavobacterium ustbae]
MIDNKNSIEGEISLKEMLNKFREWYNYFLLKWKIIVLGGIVGALLGLSFSFIKKPIYTATLTFAIEDDKSTSGLSGALGLASSIGLDIGGSGGSVFSGANLTELFKSRSMVEQTLLTPVDVKGKFISLAEMYIQNKKWRKRWQENSKLKSIEFLPNGERKYFTRVHDSILGLIYKDLSLNNLEIGVKEKKSTIINIDMSSTDELFAKYFTEALVKQVSSFYINTKSKKARTNMAVLEHQVDSIRNELNGAITGVAIANDDTFNLNPALNVKRAPSAKREVDVRANTAILTELVKQSELAKVTLRKETPLIQIIDSPILPLAKERFGKAKGLFLGGVIGGFLVMLLLFFKEFFKQQFK